MAPQPDVSESMSKLSVSSKKDTKKQPEEVADSWEDEDVSDSDSETAENIDIAQSDSTSGPKTPTATPAPSAPPPTPMSPSYGPGSDWDYRQSGASSTTISSRSDGRRPEKTDAVARRLIAAGLGLKAPKQTEEQKAYQKSVREQERKRKEQEKEIEKNQQTENDKAKAAIWST